MSHLRATQEQIDRQIEWEGANIAAGVDRYRASLIRSVTSEDGTRTEAISVADSKPGTVIMQDVMSHLVPAVEEARQQAISGISGSGKGRPPSWWWLIAWLPADALSVITCRTLLARRITDSYQGVRAAKLANLVGQCVQSELEFRQWKRESSRASKQDDERIDLAKLLVSRRKGNVNLRTFRAWRQKCAEIEKLDWTHEQRLALGAKLIQIAIEHGLGWFEMRRVRISRGRSEAQIFLSEDAEAAMGLLHEQFEAARPYLLPMTCPPKPWRRTADA